jgi:dipeptidyl aminopeptidase/acylaminoacyl peptidase
MIVFKHTAADQLFGKPADQRQAEAEAASPAAHVSKDDPPILIVHGTNDGTVPFAQAELFYEKLKQSGVDVTLVRIEGGGHGIGGPEVMERVVSFFDKHLRGQEVEVSGEPIKAASNRSR